MAQLYRVLYCSRNGITGTPDEIVAEVRGILGKSRKNNARSGVTGGLLFSQGCFAQVLEGPFDAVQGTFERIQCDERHEDVTVLQSGRVDRRDFADWSMAFVGADPSAHPLTGATLAEAFSGQSAAGDEILALLKSVVVREDEWLRSSDTAVLDRGRDDETSARPGERHRALAS